MGASECVNRGKPPNAVRAKGVEKEEDEWLVRKYVEGSGHDTL